MRITIVNMIIADSKKTGPEAVPESFPGTISLLTTSNGKIILDPKYRKYNECKNEEFDYFTRQILSVSNPNVTKYNEKKYKELISDIYSVPDEAFGLLIIYNELHVWKKQDEQIKKGESVTRERKRFCDGKSGNRQGWTLEGIKLYNSLCRQVSDRRNETKHEEIMIRKRFAEEKQASENGITTNNTKGSTTDEADGGSSDSEKMSYYIENAEHLCGGSTEHLCGGSTDSSVDSEN